MLLRRELWNVEVFESTTRDQKNLKIFRGFYKAVYQEKRGFQGKGDLGNNIKKFAHHLVLRFHYGKVRLV